MNSYQFKHSPCLPAIVFLNQSVEFLFLPRPLPPPPLPQRKENWYLYTARKSKLYEISTAKEIVVHF